MLIALSPSPYLIEPAMLRIPHLPPAHLLPAMLRAPQFLPPSLFETHLSLWIVAIATGAIILFLGRTRNHLRLGQTGAAILALSIVWIVAAIIFDTPAERLHKAHAAMAAAAEKGDFDTVLQYLAPEFTIEGVTFHAQAGETDRDQLAAELRDSHIREVHITHYESTLTCPTDAQTTVAVLVVSDSIPPLTTWHVTWKDLPSADWRITAASLTAVGNEAVPPGGISAMH